MTRIILAALAIAGTITAARAEGLDPALTGRDVRVCQGILTAGGTCIGSESNVAPESYDGTTVYRPVRPDDDEK
jgi:hypothetical protein